MKTYVDIHAHVGLYGAFWIYSGVSVAGLFFVCCVVPETKGVELEEMEHHSVAQTGATVALNPNSPPNATTVTSCTPAPSSASSNIVSTTNSKAYLPSTKDNYYPPPLQTPPGAKLPPRSQLHLNLKLNSYVHSNLPDHLQPSENLPLQYRHPGRFMMTHLGPTHSMPYESIQQHEEMENEFSHLTPSVDYSHHHRYIDPYYYRHAQPQLPPSSLSPYHHRHHLHDDLVPDVPLLYTERDSLYMPPHLEQSYHVEEETEYGLFPYSSRLTTGPFRPKRGTVV